MNDEQMDYNENDNKTCLAKCDSDEKPSDLSSLEIVSENTLNNIKKVRGRLINLLEKIKKTECCEKEAEKPEQAPNNRLNIVENTIRRMDDEATTFNELISELEGILR